MRKQNIKWCVWNVIFKINLLVKDCGWVLPTIIVQSLEKCRKCQFKVTAQVAPNYIKVDSNCS